MSKKNSIAAALMVAGMALCSSASAQVYVGGALSQARWDVDCTGTSTCKDADTAYKFFAGYDFTPNLGVEASYFALGDVTASAGDVKGSFNAKGLDFAGVIKAPSLMGVVGFAKAGVAFVNGESGGTIAGVSASTSKSSAQALYGLGLMFAIGDKTSIRAEVERRKVKVANLDSATSNVSTFSIGLQASY